jgi:hypothetical protein
LLPRQFLLVLPLLLDRADFLGLFQECPARVPGRGDGEYCKDCGRHAVSWVAKMSDMGEGYGTVRVRLPFRGERGPVRLLGAGRCGS